ncbi:energy-coupling factor transport system substrate-specific component [Stackebrandtia endophytica]|uniref:Energy-coupling factor transport system substrate-specific component n=1 Tax=Stackebrandtia endophytica TaxID=1496996 RepID=A0A543ASB1_9ACTN|nr:ECF transporter S component [Stackebrandtia endophytica]TQL75471.1 energy-coupling factor transport system substrate-specific component [Stackebrandtia endophytica]
MTTTTPFRWRTIDIVVAATLAVAFGVVFWAWAFVWETIQGALVFYPPLKALIYGLWLMPAVMAPLIIRKPGAALFTEGLASTVSALLGSFWGIMVVWQGLAQGLAGEIAFATGRYRRFGVPTALVGGALTGLTATIWDCVVYYPTLSFAAYQLPYVLIGTVSCIIIAGLGSHLLTKALANTGVLDRFGPGRERKTV